MNRFLLFAYDVQYPTGGMNDCEFMSNNWNEIYDRWKKLTFERCHVYDCETGRQYDEADIFLSRFG
jgi:hypothetical protein